MAELRARVCLRCSPGIYQKTFVRLGSNILQVPLDYSKPSGIKALVPIIKISATTAPYKGIVFINPGGPGSSAVDWLLGAGKAIEVQKIVGTNYDVAVYEPRGIGYSQPVADCDLPLAKRIYNQAYGPRLSPDLYVITNGEQQALATQCASKIGGVNQAGPHMTTQVVARDAISILDAYAASPYSAGVQNPKYFNFWGISYGTVIGQTFAQLFSNRVGRFVLDGVNDAEDYYSGTGLKNIPLADLALSRFFDYCAKAGSACSFTAPTGFGVYQRFERLVLKLDFKKGQTQGWANATALYVALSVVKGFGTVALSNSIGPTAPSLASYADTLAYLEALGDGITLEALAIFSGPTLNPQWLPAVLCPDTGNKVLGKSLAQLQPQLNSIDQQSWIAGELFASIGISCAHWSIKPKTRYTGTYLRYDVTSPVLI
jgi:pimeloyl-ACP methyl ester carboxylesterase